MTDAKEKTKHTPVRATLAEHDGLSFRDTARMAHPVDLADWQERGLIRIDVDAGCFRLSKAGG